MKWGNFWLLFLAPDDMCAIHAIHIFTEIVETCAEFALKIISGCALHARDKNYNANEDSLKLFSSPCFYLPVGKSSDTVRLESIFNDDVFHLPMTHVYAKCQLVRTNKFLKIDNFKKKKTELILDGMDEWMVSCRNYSTEIHSNRKPQMFWKLARGRLHLLCHSNRLILSLVNIQHRSQPETCPNKTEFVNGVGNILVYLHIYWKIRRKIASFLVPL